MGTESSVFAFFSSTAQQPLVGQVLLIIKTSQSHSNTPHLVGLLWTNDQPASMTPTWQHTTLTRETFMFTVGSKPTIPASQRPKVSPLFTPCNIQITWLCTVICWIIGRLIMSQMLMSCTYITSLYSDEQEIWVIYTTVNMFNKQKLCHLYKCKHI
jgi:hypothetical protein